MKLKDIIKGIDCELRGEAELEVKDLQFDSRKVSAGTLFVAQRGTKVDGHDFIVKAMEAGAVAVVCEEIPATQSLSHSVTYIKVKDSSKALGEMAANFYGHPSRSLKLIGITGTNGKTTTVTLLHRMFRLMGHHVGLVSTIVNKIDEEELPTGHTTPDALELNQLLRKMVDAGCDFCFMEVSSHAVVQHRIAGVEFAGGIFSNITHDHLDFHKTFANYIAAKKSFFDKLPKSAFALTNVDDKNGRVMVQNTKAAVHTYSLRTAANFKGIIMENTFTGLHMRINNREVYFKLCGKFNAYNLLAIYGTAVLLGMDEYEALAHMSLLESAAGRFQMLPVGNGSTAIVDYAHTPDALENVLKTIRDIVGKEAEVITVVGCGGDRDALKRPEMAEIACKFSSKVILTSDNPRTEDPMAILNDMQKGVSASKSKQVLVIENRHEAIKTACMMLKTNGVLLVAGKGHENYQEINHVKHQFDDTEERTNFFNVK